MRVLLCSAIALSVLIGGGAAATAETMSTAADPAIASTNDQIDAYLKSSPALALPDAEEIDALQEERERKVHGEVGVAVGTGGYRDVYARSDFPVGKTGTLSVAVRETKFKGRFGPYDRQGVSLGLAMGGAASREAEDCDWDAETRPTQRSRSADPRSCEGARIYRPGLGMHDRPAF